MDLCGFLRPTRSVRSLSLVALLPLILGLAACNGSNPDLPSNVANGTTVVPGIPDGTTPPLANDPSPGNPDQMRIAVKYVALQAAATDAPSPSQAEVVTLLQNMSQYWGQCNIAFQLEEYVAPVASDRGLDYTPANQSDHTAMRSEFDDGKRALIVKTGTWDRSGNLGNDGSNGFSTMPPDSPEGFVVEENFATHALLLSHEAGHLIGGLDHTGSTTNLMNHFVTASTTLLSAAQCEQARATMMNYHSAWIR